MKLKDVEAILRNEKYYKNLVHLHFMETGKSDNLNIQNKTYGNTTEKNIVNKMENKNYKEALKYLKAIEILQSQLEIREKIVYNHRYKHKMSVERISYEVHYSVSTIWLDLNTIKKKFIKILEKL